MEIEIRHSDTGKNPRRGTGLRYLTPLTRRGPGEKETRVKIVEEVGGAHAKDGDRARFVGR